MQFLLNRISKLTFQNFLNFLSVKLQHETLENTEITFQQFKIFFSICQPHFLANMVLLKQSVI